MSIPPTGTVTFLFTDVEGSTALWDCLPLQMDRALRRHDEILRSTVEPRGDTYSTATLSLTLASLRFPPGVSVPAISPQSTSKVSSMCCAAS